MYNPLCTVTLSRLALATFLGDENQHFYFFFVYNMISYDIIILKILYCSCMTMCRQLKVVAEFKVALYLYR